ncbi:hypothetical protein MVEN_01914400 [Mycena venus]|uniref:Uncharacterized protein n=1 Tax=Mycena venus TaxID=2733690 RepID=A0A8H6XG93_9AGAR|nr:hypothetical protein MVEN_01914400 [Mycena venus]
MASPSSLRRQRQTNTLEMFEDLEHEINAVWAGSSPDSKAFQVSLLQRLDRLKERVSPEASTTAVSIPPAKKARTEPSAPPPGPATLANAGSADLVQKPRLPRGRAQEKKAEARLHKLLHLCENQPPLTKEEFLENIQHSDDDDLKRAEKEDAAIRRLIRGYGRPGCTTAWRDFFAPHFAESATINIAEKVESITKRNDLAFAARMKATHEALHNDKKLINTTRLADYMLYHVSVASFGIDWRQIKGKDSINKKQAFYHSIFQSTDQFSPLFAGMTREQCQHAIKNTYKSTYKAWRSGQEQLVTARGRFVDLYLAFGPAIFMDPFWKVESLADDARTKEFPALLELLINNMPDDYDTPGVSVAAARWRGSCDSLGGVARAMDRDLFYCLKEFFNTHPDEVEDVE